MTATMMRATEAGLGLTSGGYNIVLSPGLADGTVMIDNAGHMLIGTRPLTLMEEVGREARRIVRDGMADVLTWVGQPVHAEPTSEEILESLWRLTEG